MADAFPPGTYEHWGRCQMLFPHAELVLEYRPVDEGFLRQWVAVLDNVAWYTQRAGQARRSRADDSTSTGWEREGAGKEYPETLTSVSNLASVL